MKEQKWLELKIPKTGYDHIQRDVAKNNVVDDSESYTVKHLKALQEKDDTHLIDPDILDDSGVGIMHGQLEDVNDDECDKENVYMLCTDRTKSDFPDRRRFQVTILLLIAVSIIIIIMLQSFYKSCSTLSTKDQKISQNNTMNFVYDIM